MQIIFTLLTIHLFRQSVAPAQHFSFSFFRDTFFFFISFCQPVSSFRLD